MEYARDEKLKPALLGDLFEFPQANANWLMSELLAGFRGTHPGDADDEHGGQRKASAMEQSVPGKHAVHFGYFDCNPVEPQRMCWILILCSGTPG